MLKNDYSDFSTFYDADGRFRSLSLQNLVLFSFELIKERLEDANFSNGKKLSQSPSILLRELLKDGESDQYEIERKWSFICHRINRRWKFIEDFLLSCHEKSIPDAHTEVKTEEFIKEKNIVSEAADTIRHIGRLLSAVHEQEKPTSPYSKKTLELSALLCSPSTLESEHRLKVELKKISLRNQSIQNIILVSAQAFAESNSDLQSDRLYFHRFLFVLQERINEQLPPASADRLSSWLTDRHYPREVELYIDSRLRKSPLETKPSDISPIVNQDDLSREEALEAMIAGGKKGKLSQTEIDEILRKYLG